ncbi:unnamed protein product [Parnassius mnemosyne]|uniref:Reverse transcriptase Ty1/copia-type domain-containing protein n=1 Tax=Parnassius mnemosyne TaxID=213953 RepID=A0AAV1K9Z3_9NEOP
MEEMVLLDMLSENKVVEQHEESEEEFHDTNTDEDQGEEQDTFRIFVSVATKLTLNISQMDVCGAFLNAKLDEELYLSLPEETEVKFVKLNKSIYGLKRSPKYWNETFNNVMLSMDYKQFDKGYCLYSKCEGKNKTSLLLYVDDILYFGNNKLEQSKLRNTLCQTFKVNQDLDSGVTNFTKGLHKKHFVRI